MSKKGGIKKYSTFIAKSFGTCFACGKKIHKGNKICGIRTNVDNYYIHARCYDKKQHNLIQIRSKPARTKRATGENHVYIFDLGQDNLFKIGAATNWQMRLYALSASNPSLEPVVVSLVTNQYASETSIHEQFKQQRVSRELFRLDNQQLTAAIDTLRKWGEIVYERQITNLEPDKN